MQKVGKAICDVCGRARPVSEIVGCRLCSLAVCDLCDATQAGVGHLAAEHKHEERRRG